MTTKIRGSLRSSLPLAMCLLVFAASPALADGRFLLGTKRGDGMEVSVFTDPPPLRTGAVEISVMVVPLRKGIRLPAPSFKVCAYPSGQPEKLICDESVVRTTALNQVFRAGRLDIPEAGKWQVEIESDITDGAKLGPFAIEVIEGTSSNHSWLLWLGLPVAAVAVFAVHQRLVHRRSTRPAPASSAAAEPS
jgi:hypothetical protein